MLIKPAISDDAILARLQDSYGLSISQVSFLPLGDQSSALYRVTADSGALYFLKLRKGAINEIAVTVPAFLHAQGIRQVMAPIATTSQALWTQAHDFNWILYPFFAGETGFDVALSQAQWMVFGRCMKSIHGTIFPAGSIEHVPQEDSSAGSRERVKTFLKQAARDRYADPTAASFAALLLQKHDEIQTIVERAGQLAQILRSQTVELVLCHSDLHGRNILVGANDEMTIVDWDAPILAPKERDLMFIGGGVGGIWNDDREAEWFYQGYGQTEVDLAALAYYRYERIVEDIAEFSEQVFNLRGSIEDRQKRLRLREQFLPNNVVPIAHRSYQRLSRRAPG